MQAKIDAFFKPSAARNTMSTLPDRASPPGGKVELPADAENTHLDLLITYDPECHEGSCQKEDEQEASHNHHSQAVDDASVSSAKGLTARKVLNKKRSYAQYYLQFGQSDFLLHTCVVCGMRYARGDESDEKIHKTFHANYYQGIPFKGWSNERVILTKVTGDRIVLVLDGDPPAHKQKVQQLVKLLESELGLSDGWLLHKLCKVYLFISNSRIIGCVFAEPIKKAFRVVPNSPLSSGDVGRKLTESTPSMDHSDDIKLRGPDRTKLQFGNISFRREVMRRPSHESISVNACYGAAIFCEKEPVPAVCGIRAIWVVPSKRRQHIATELLHYLRKNFEPNSLLEASDLAFSQPTSAGKVLASTYSKTESFLVYMPEDK